MEKEELSEQKIILIEHYLINIINEINSMNFELKAQKPYIGYLEEKINNIKINLDEIEKNIK